GPRCDHCAKGYRRYPACEPCPCDRAGSVNEECDGECICKPNVRGPRCDTCAPGHFHLDAHNPVGCTPCYCNGVTNACGAAALAVYTVVEHENWSVADLSLKRVVAAAREGTDVHIAHDDMGFFEAYYWLAPQEYLGRRMTSYGQTLTVKVSWVRLRGDTSGRPTRCPDVIIEGAGYRIAYGDNSHRGRKATLEIPFYEHDWFHFPKDITDITSKTQSTSYRGEAVTRRQMMEILSSMESLMIRARYHTVQVEGVLHDVILEYGKEGTATLVTGAVERCNCPRKSPPPFPSDPALPHLPLTPPYSPYSPGVLGPLVRILRAGVSARQQHHLRRRVQEVRVQRPRRRLRPLHGRLRGVPAQHRGRALRALQGRLLRRPRPRHPRRVPAVRVPAGLGDKPLHPRCVPDLDLGYKCQCPAGYEGPRCET
ncbi:putative laminin subunit alpha-1 isoform X2, partial [Penaeus vannamei]